MCILKFLSSALLITYLYGCQTAASVPPYLTTSPKVLSAHKEEKDSGFIPFLAPYSQLSFVKEEVLKAAPGTKSVLFNSSGTKLYAMNLEGMSVYEFDQASRRNTREYIFTPTYGTGWDYITDKPVPSFQEKPVEACFTHHDSVLWVSLHNASGIVPIWTEENKLSSHNKELTAKEITIHYPNNSTEEKIYSPLIKTGKTPKVMAATSDNQYLLVSNWHSNSISVLKLNGNEYPYGKVIATVPVSSIPRGMVIDEKRNKTYVAIMGGSSIAVIDNTQWKQESTIQVSSNPRHLVMDSSGRLFVSFNKSATIACIDPVTGKKLFSAITKSQPRTIKLSRNQKFLFVTCYGGNSLEVFKIEENKFRKVASLPCSGKPVGVDIYENNDKLEAWVCCYTTGAIRVYTFKKTGQSAL